MDSTSSCRVNVIGNKLKVSEKKLISIKIIEQFIRQFGFSLAKSILRESELCIPPTGIFRGNPPLSCLTHDQAFSAFFFEGKDTSEAGLTDRRIGLNMNYSIIFTEISFFSETSILLQII